MPVLIYVDVDGLVDFGPNIHVRKLLNETKIREIPGQIKFMVYGVGTYEQDHEFDLIFNSLKNETITGVFALIEAKANKVLECYAGDLLYDFRQKMISFRETLIRTNITHPSKSRTDLNQRLFWKRAEVFANFNQAIRLLPLISMQNTNLTLRQELRTAPPRSREQLAERYELNIMLGEGNVSVCLNVEI